MSHQDQQDLTEEELGNNIPGAAQQGGDTGMQDESSEGASDGQGAPDPGDDIGVDEDAEADFLYEEEWDDEEDEEDEEDDLDTADLEDTDASDPDDPFGILADADDDFDEFLSPQARACLESGVLQHDAHFFVKDEPVQHPHVGASTCHSQTADACAFLPRPAGAAGAADDVGEEVVVSHKLSISIWRLSAGQPARLMARVGTFFRHYSIAASACGNFVAASGNHALLILFRVQRGSSSSSRSTTQPAAGSTTDTKGAAAAAALPWKLVHEATLLCKTERETMVNSVRFGSFAGLPRLLVAHQDGMLYMFNLPGSKATARPPAAAATAAASHHPLEAVGTAAAPPAGPVAGAELMVQGLPDWKPLGSQMNRQFVEKVMGLLEQQQQQQQGGMDAAASAQTAAASKAAREWQEQAPQPGQMGAPETAAGTEAAATGARRPYAAAAACTGVAGRGTAADTPPTLPPGSLAQVEAAVASAADVLGVAIRRLSSKCAAAAAALRWGFDASGVKQQLAGCSWRERAQHVAQLLQDEEFLYHLAGLQQARLGASGLPTDRRLQERLRGYTAALEGLRTAAASQQAMLGLLGPQQQQQQWQQQQQHGLPGSADGDGDTDFAAAVGRAAYALLLLRLLAPCNVPQMKPTARVILLRHGPSVDPSSSPTGGEVRGAPRLHTCAISKIAPDAAAQLRATALAAHAHAALMVAAAQPNLMAAAQVAAHDAQMALAQQQHLPLNICECSPDGKWLAVGVDQAAVLLLPAAPGYQLQPALVLDLCPCLDPRQARWEAPNSLGCQYVAFNSSSTLLAATSDKLRMTSVFEVSSGQLVATFTLNNRPVLPVRFAPADLNGKLAKQQQQDAGSSSSSSTWGDGLLVYCERHGGLHIADLSTLATPTAPTTTLDTGATGSSSSSHKFYLKSYSELQLPAQPAAAAAGPQQQQQQPGQQQPEAEAMLGAAGAAAAAAEGETIHGLAVTPSGRVLVACESGLMELHLLQCWAQAVHTRLPARFKQAVRLLLLAASRSSSKAGTTAAEQAMLSSSSASSSSSRHTAQLSQLPAVVLEQIISAAALPQGCWADVVLPTQQQLQDALSSRPGPQHDPVLEFQNAMNIVWQQHQFAQQQQQPQI